MVTRNGSDEAHRFCLSNLFHVKIVVIDDTDDNEIRDCCVYVIH